MRRLLSPLTTLFAVWSFAFCLYFSGIIRYERIPRSWGVLYLLVCLALFAFGHRVGEWNEFSGKRTGVSPKGIGPGWEVEVRKLSCLISVLAVCGIAAAALFFVDMVFFVGIDPLNLAGARLLFVERQAIALSKIASVIGAGGLFSLSAAILCWEHISPGKRTLWLLSPLLLSVFSILSSGRQTIFQLVLLLTFAIILRRSRVGQVARSITWKLVIGLMAIGIVVLSYGVAVVRERNGLVAADFDQKEVLLNIFDARFIPEVDALIDALPAQARDGTAELLLYFSHEIPSFLVFWESSPPGPYFGLWEFPFIARRLESAGLVTSTVDDRMATVYASFAQSGRFSHVWQTWTRDLIIDFGRTGALLLIIALGFASGRVYRQCRERGRLSSTFLYLGIQLCCTYSVLLSAVSDTMVMFYMIGAFLLYRSGRGHRTLTRNAPAAIVSFRLWASRGLNGLRDGFGKQGLSLSSNELRSPVRQQGE
jgi:hypothetical protein